MGRAHEVRKAAMAKTAAAKSKLNNKYGRLIFVAAKSGEPDPELNQLLKKEIERAKREQVSADVIKRAIEKAKGSDSESYVPARYEGFGPNNSMFIIDCLTDNPNRTYIAVRTAFSRANCKLGVTGSVVHMFDNLAVFSFEGLDEIEVLDTLIETECEITEISEDDGLISVFGPITEYAKIKQALLDKNPDLTFLEDQVSWIPQAYVTLSDEGDLNAVDRLFKLLNEIDDLSDIYHNIEDLNLSEEE